MPLHKVISWESKGRELNAVGWSSGIYQLQILSLHLGERCWLKTFLIPIILWASLPPRTWLDGSLLFSVFLPFIPPDLLLLLQQSAVQCFMPQCRRLSCFWGHHQKLLSHWVCRTCRSITSTTAIAIFIIFFFPIVKPSFVAVVSFYLWQLKSYRLRFFSETTLKESVLNPQRLSVLSSLDLLKILVLCLFRWDFQILMSNLWKEDT